MPAHQHRTGRFDEPGEPPSDGPERTAVRVAPVADADDSSTELALQIERAQLRARLRALEHELEARQRRHQEVVYRYEQVLSDRSSDDSDDAPSRRRSRLKALLVPGQ